MLLMMASVAISCSDPNPLDSYTRVPFEKTETDDGNSDGDEDGAGGLFEKGNGTDSKPYMIMNDNYCGDGGIPGYIFTWLVPSEHTKSRLPVALAHETNHNVRFQFIKWHNDITLAEMMISEGLAENFATYLYGEENVGSWVSKTDLETLNGYIKPIIRGGLDVQGLDNLTAYLYGDEMAKMQNYFPVGLPYCAGYACGYHMIKYYLKKTGKSIIEATKIPADEILKEVEGFWDES